MVRASLSVGFKITGISAPTQNYTYELDITNFNGTKLIKTPIIVGTNEKFRVSYNDVCLKLINPYETSNTSVEIEITNNLTLDLDYKYVLLRNYYQLL